MTAQAGGSGGGDTGGTAMQRRSGVMGIAGWMLFDWAAQPFYTLVTTFLFPPYFMAHIIGDGDKGQALWGYTVGAGALLVALGSPILGAMADARGKLKPYMAILSVFFVTALASLWYAKPGTLHLWAVILPVIVAMMAAEYSAVLSNSLMPRLVSPERLGRISGTGWAIGYFGGLASIAFMAAFVLVDTKTGMTLLNLEPLFPLDIASHEPERFVGPFAAVWFLLFALPFFIFTPDATTGAAGRTPALREVFATLWSTLQHIRSYRNIALFFLARMVFVDGLLAIFQFGGLYAYVIFSWEPVTLGLFGVILTLSGGVGALVGGFLDDRIGPKNVLLGALVILMVCAVGVISIDKTHVLFWIEVAPRAATATLFDSAGERLFIALAIVIGLTSGPLQAASRSLLARMAPAEHMSEFFGFFAFSGKITAFAAPILIATVTTLTGSQRIGMSVILGFLGLGLALMTLVRVQKAAAPE